MGWDGSDYGQSMRQLLRLLRTQVGMDVAWISEFSCGYQLLRTVDVEPGAEGPPEGLRLPLNGAYCTAVVSGRMPGLLPDARQHPVAALLDVTFELHIGAYMGVPMTDPDGTVSGMVCLTSARTAPTLSDRELRAVRLTAELIGQLRALLADADRAATARSCLEETVRGLCAGIGRRLVLQPIFDVRTGQSFAVEALTRFDDVSRTPAEWFAAADTVGLGTELQLATARTALKVLRDDATLTSMAINLSPHVVLAGHLDELLVSVDPARVILELTEHAPVPSYPQLQDTLDRHRAAGLRIAVDDTGAGYASLTHVLSLHPDIAKIDLSLVRGVDTDPARSALVEALVRFGAALSCLVIAEGVETPAELQALVDLRCPYAQGYLFGQPEPSPPRSSPVHAHRA